MNEILQDYKSNWLEHLDRIEDNHISMKTFKDDAMDRTATSVMTQRAYEFIP
jgi:hypothetical protein